MTIDRSGVGPTMRLMRTVTRPPANLVPFRNVHAVLLCQAMREDEIEQYIALTGSREFDPEAAARGFMTTRGHKFTLLGHDDLPACAGGYEEIIPGVWQSWMVGSMEGWKNWREITRGSRWMMDGLFELGARRLQTTALASRTKAREWYERGLGLQLEGIWRQYGTNGEDVACYSRVRED